MADTIQFLVQEKMPLKTTTILLVEDTAELAQVIIRELRSNQYHVLHAIDGVTALRLHEKENPERKP